MFNGIIKNTGKITNIEKNKKDSLIKILSKVKFTRREIGSSISCSGTCLTLSRIKGNSNIFYLSPETLKRTNFSYAKKGDIVNLEKSLKYGNRVSGHFVQGHVDTTTIVKKIQKIGKSWLFNFVLKKKDRKYVIEKGSISINGVSLTISNLLKNSFQIAVIPQTYQLTNLKNLKKNDVVNVEFDIFGKYINKFLKNK